MRFILGSAILVSLVATAVAEPVAVSDRTKRVADATTDACLANCASQAESCKRACPTTFRTPCVSACDSQAQTCTQSCRTR